LHVPTRTRTTGREKWSLSNENSSLARYRSESEPGWLKCVEHASFQRMVGQRPLVPNDSFCPHDRPIGDVAYLGCREGHGTGSCDQIFRLRRHVLCLDVTSKGSRVFDIRASNRSQFHNTPHNQRPPNSLGRQFLSNILRICYFIICQYTSKTE
jgi:hypothetical protein